MNPSIIAGNHAKDFREEVALKDDDVVGDIVLLITKTAGYKYEETNFSEPFYGCCEYIGDGVFKISYNLKFNWNEAFKRFTLAHELGHISIHHEYLREHILHRCYSHDQFIKPMEIEADSFAANFLAPSKSCLRLISNKEFNPETIRFLANHFNISTYAAGIRFVELTDLSCSLIILNDKGKTEYERRSPRMEEILKPFFIPYIRKTPIHENTLANEFINGKRDKETCISELNLWHPKLLKKVEITESVIDLGFNGKFMAMITPTIPNLDEYLSEEDRSSTIHSED
jgi:Zn-dependent peptidase ImmA (M78 family)